MDSTNEQPSVRFDEEQRVGIPPTETSRMVQWVMKYSGGLVKDEKQANYVLIGIALVAIGISLFLFVGATRSPAPSSPNDIIEIAGPEGIR